MKALLSIAIIAITSLPASAFANFSDNPTSSCDPSWNACAIGRADPFNQPGSGDPPGKFLIDFLYASQAEIQSKIPMIGQGALGGAQSDTPHLQAYAAPGSVDVMLQTGVQPGPTQTIAIGTISSPIGTDTSTTYARAIKLNPGVTITEGPTQSTEQTYCDPGGVLGATIYDEVISKTSYQIAGATQQPIIYQVQRLLIKSSTPSLLGCGH